MTPGAYLKHRRQAAMLDVVDVAAALRTEPHTDEHVRRHWIDLIEADAMPATFNTIVALTRVYPIDLYALEKLVAIQLGFDVPPPRLCAICASGFFEPHRGPDEPHCHVCRHLVRDAAPASTSA